MLELNQIINNFQDAAFQKAIEDSHKYLNCQIEDLFIVGKRAFTGYLVKEGSKIISKSYVGTPSDEITNVLYNSATLNGIKFVKIYDGEFQYIINKNDYNKFCRYCNKLRLDDLKKNKPIKPIMSDEVERILKDEIFDFFVHGKDAEECNVKLTKGICLQGEPGNGKTSILKWVNSIAKTKKLTYECVTAAALQASMGHNKLEQQMHNANIVCFDDIDIAMFSRATSGGVANALLSAMDGPSITVKKPILRIFTTNEKLNDVDDAFKRPGRIDKFITIDLPDANLRRRFIDSWHPRITKHLSETDKQNIVNNTEATSFAWMESIKSELFKQIMQGKVDIGAAIEDGKSFAIKQQHSVGFGGSFAPKKKKERD